MKKQCLKTTAAVMSVFFILTGCAGTAQNKEQTAQTVKEDTIVNPMVSYDTIEELEKAVGFTCKTMPEHTGYTLARCESIDKMIGQMVYMDKGTGEKEFVLRTAKGNADISGYYGVTYEERELDGVVINLGFSGADAVAWWCDEEYAYSATAADIDEQVFLDCLSTVVK